MDSEMIDIAVLLRRVQLRKQAACDQALARWEMTLPQWGMLRAVAARPDSSTHALALVTGQSDQAAGAVVARLEQRGLLERHNGRGKTILHRATATGTALLNDCDEAIAQTMRASLSGLDDNEIHTLRDLLGRFT